MKLRALQKIDWFIGLGLAVFLAPITRLIGVALRRDHSFNSTGSIVVMKLLGGGNFALAMPMLLGLRKSFPASKLTAVTTPSTAEFAKVIGVFDSVLIIDTRSVPSLFYSALRTLIAIFKVDVIFDLEVHSKLSTCFGLFTCARNRVGFFTNDFFLREYLYTHLVFFNARAARPVLFERLVGIIGGRCASYDECEAHLKAAVKTGDKRPGLITIGVGCSELGKVRQLNADQWVRYLISELKDSQQTIVFLGAKGDYALAQSVLDKLRSLKPDLQIENLCGAKSLVESVAILSSAQKMYAIDSALLHFARLLKVSATSFWGPTDPTTLLAPIEGYNEVVHYRPIICAPCIHVAEIPPCEGRNLCISGLFQDLPVSDTEALINITITPGDKIMRSGFMGID